MIRALFFSSCLLLACAPSTTAPVTVMAMVLSNGEYQPQQVQLTTLTDLISFSGAVAVLRGGADIRVDGSDPLLQTNNGNLTEDQLERIFVKNAGREPRGNFVGSGGVFWPADFHTWNLTTTYFNLEQAFLYFQAMGAAGEDIALAKVYYFPSFVLAETSNEPLKDNALYFSPIRAFAILPFNQLQELPLAMNSGVIAHEFSHWVFNRLVYGGRGIPEPFEKWLFGVTPQINILKSLDEGLADYHAHGASCAAVGSGCDTRFLSASLSDYETAVRDIGLGPRCMTADLRYAINNSPINNFSGLEYSVGTIIAASLHLAANGNPATREIIQRAVIASYTDGNSLTPGLAQLIATNLVLPENFTLASVANVILNHITDTTIRADVCSRFMDNLQIARDAMPACPPAAANPGTCPLLP
jgi:hypothetical protein